MLGILVQLLLSWVLLWVFCRQHLEVLGLLPTGWRLLHAFLGLLVAGGCCAVYFYSVHTLAGNRWLRNPTYSFHDFFDSAGWMLRSVVYEELLFRGALLYIIWKKFNARLACGLSAVAFCCYHWFTFGILGQLLPMLFTFLLTAAWGLMFAWSFKRTGALYLPIGLHFGWNIVQLAVFSQGAATPQWLSSTGDGRLGTGLSLIWFLFQLLAVPLLVWLGLRRNNFDRRLASP